MKRGSPPYRALSDALPLARRRGITQAAVRAPENLYDFTIVSALPLAFVRVTSCSRIHAPAAELANEFRDELFGLGRIPVHTDISRELWLRSRHGTWRFLRLTPDSLVELGQDGRVLLGKTAAAGKKAILS
ncbi:hypothetical protein [Methanoregula sp. UBA64]|jgi:hypothetical protein|uniref:hypothetical protein n=1 Tax=Methanoregula sp. UBA64 TaxID=1915554 RepID=UPI0025F027A4|nr:hypothetical protein [Methanoregula sp. UBA64]